MQRPSASRSPSRRSNHCLHRSLAASMDAKWCARMDTEARTVCSGCKVLFPTTFRMLKSQQVPLKNCPSCRKRAVERVTRHAQTPKGQSGRKKLMQEYRVAGKMREAMARYYKSPKGRAMQKKDNSKVSKQMQSRICRQIRNHGYSSATLARTTEFVNNQAMRDHFESTFESWMNWSNYGRQKSRHPYKTTWQYGHRIPCAAYDFSNPEDVRRCYSKANIFAQCARENHEAGSKLPDNKTLASLESVWPTGWVDGLN